MFLVLHNLITLKTVAVDRMPALVLRGAGVANAQRPISTSTRKVKKEMARENCQRVQKNHKRFGYDLTLIFQ